LDNQWIYLMVIDPMKNNLVEKYEKGMKWTPVVHHSDIIDENSLELAVEIAEEATV